MFIFLISFSFCAVWVWEQVRIMVPFSSLFYSLVVCCILLLECVPFLGVLSLKDTIFVFLLPCVELSPSELSSSEVEESMCSYFLFLLAIFLLKLLLILSNNLVLSSMRLASSELLFLLFFFGRRSGCCFQHPLSSWVLFHPHLEQYFFLEEVLFLLPDFSLFLDFCCLFFFSW